MNEIDKTDQELLKLLMKNSRMPVTQLAKKLKISREVATYRLNKLKKEEIILDFVSEIDISKLGFIGAAVFVNVKAARQKEFEQFLKASPFVSWVAQLSGVWSFGFSIIGKSNEELDKRFLQIYHKFREDIIDHRFTLHRKSSFFYEKYFGELPELKKKKKLIDYPIDFKDKMLLQELAKDARISAVSLSQNVALTAPAVAHRIKQLEASGYIQKYSLFVNLRKLGLSQYSIFVINKSVDEKEKLVKYLAQHPQVSFIAEYVGDQFIEFGIFIKDAYELRERLQEIEEKFPNNRVIEVSLFQKEFVSTGPPDCVFE